MNFKSIATRFGIKVIKTSCGGALVSVLFSDNKPGESILRKPKQLWVGALFVFAGMCAGAQGQETSSSAEQGATDEKTALSQTALSQTALSQNRPALNERETANVSTMSGVADVNSAEQPARQSRAGAENTEKEDRDESRLYLESTFVGDKEQPTVSYFIPWKETGTPDNLHWNIEQKNDNTLDVIDRDILIRSMSIYNDLNMENIPPAAEAE